MFYVPFAHDRRFANPFRFHRNRARGDPRGAGPVIVTDDADRENEGDLILAAEKATAGNRRLHGQAHQRRDLRADGGRGTRPPGTAADDPGRSQHRAHAHGLHDQRRCRRGRLHRHLRRRPRADDPPARRARRPPRATSPGPATFSRCVTATAASCAAPGTPRPPSTSPGWPGLRPAGVLAEIVNDDGTMARVPELLRFKERARPEVLHDPGSHRLPPQSTRKTRGAHRKSSTCRPTTAISSFISIATSSTTKHHLALVKGVIEKDTPVPVRVHSECLTGDVFGSRRCDCGSQLQAALSQIEAAKARACSFTCGRRARHRPGGENPRLQTSGTGHGHRRGQRTTRLRARPARLRPRAHRFCWMWAWASSVS